MKILEVNLERGWRGGERQTLWTAQALANLGPEVTILARRGQALALAARREGVSVVEVSGNGEAWRWLWRQGHAFDVIHAQSAHALTSCVLSAWGHRRPVVATRRVAFPLRGVLTRFKYARSTRLVAISRAAAAPLEAAGLGPVDIIPSAVQLEAVVDEEVAQLRQRWVPENKKVLATVAALTAEKDPLTLVKAVQQLATQRKDFVFLHIGEGAMRPELEQAIADAGLQDVYKLTGFQDPVAPWYELFDGYVMSSRSEGLGSSVLDAMLRGIPVASTAAGGLAEVLDEGRGLLVPVGDASALAAALATLLDESPGASQSRQIQVLKARTWVEGECGVDTMSKRYLALFQFLLQQGLSQ